MEGDVAKSTESTKIGAGCERCARLDERVRELERERSDLRHALARERERANALFLAFPPAPPAASSAPPSTTSADQGTDAPLTVPQLIQRQGRRIRKVARRVGAALRDSKK